MDTGFRRDKDSKKGNKMRTLALLFVLALGLIVTSPASADPSGPNVQDDATYICNGEEVVLNGGTLTNQSHQAFVVGSPSILVATSAVLETPDGETIVFFDTAPGIEDSVTCIATFDGFTFTVRGFFTPAT
jgi:hypothetical protein